jgi:hypothetical protein
MDFKGDKNPQRAFFGEKAKPLAPCRKILLHVEELYVV